MCFFFCSFRDSSDIKFICRIEKEKNALQAEGDDLAVSLETLQKQKVLCSFLVCLLTIYCASCLFSLFVVVFLTVGLFCCFPKAQSDKQNRAIEEQLNDHKYQVSNKVDKFLAL